MQTAKNSIKDRVGTAVVLVAVVLTVGLINNFWLIWMVMGIVYLLAFHEAMRLFGINNNSLYAYAAILWLAAALYPYERICSGSRGSFCRRGRLYPEYAPWCKILSTVYPTADAFGPAHTEYG